MLSSGFLSRLVHTLQSLKGRRGKEITKTTNFLLLVKHLTGYGGREVAQAGTAVPLGPGGVPGGFDIHAMTIAEHRALLAMGFLIACIMDLADHAHCAPRVFGQLLTKSCCVVCGYHYMSPGKIDWEERGVPQIRALVEQRACISLLWEGVDVLWWT